MRANDGLNSSPWSYINLSLRLGQTPAQNAVFPTNRPTFAWTAVPNATGYTLQIDADPFFDATNLGGDGSVLQTILLGNVVSYTLKDSEKLIDQGTYYWRVMPNNGTYPAATASRAFYWANAAALKPMGLLTDPQASGLTSLTPTFKWTAITGAEVAPWVLEIARDAQMTQMVYTSPAPLAASATTFTLPTARALTPGVYYWRVYRTTETTSTIQGQPFAAHNDAHPNTDMDSIH